MTTPSPTADLTRAETIISHLLRYGVAAALIVMLIGIALTFVLHPDYMTGRDQLPQLIGSAPASAASPSAIDMLRSHHLLTSGGGIMVIGLLLLICTPVLRVATSVVIFMLQHNKAFVIITLLVLITLLISFFLGKVE